MPEWFPVSAYSSISFSSASSMLNLSYDTNVFRVETKENGWELLCLRYDWARLIMDVQWPNFPYHDRSGLLECQIWPFLTRFLHPINSQKPPTFEQNTPKKYVHSLERVREGELKDSWWITHITQGIARFCPKSTTFTFSIIISFFRPPLDLGGSYGSWSIAWSSLQSRN